MEHVWSHDASCFAHANPAQRRLPASGSRGQCFPVPVSAPRFNRLPSLILTHSVFFPP